MGLVVDDASDLVLVFLEEQELNGVMAKNKDRSRVKVKKRGVENKIRTRTRLTFPNTTACKGLLGWLGSPSFHSRILQIPMYKQ